MGKGKRRRSKAPAVIFDGMLGEPMGKGKRRRSKGPAVGNINGILEELAAVFAGTLGADEDVPFAELLERRRLDYSADSLKAVDRYLAAVRKKRKRLSDEGYGRLVHRCGAYVGEVLRRTVRARWDWVDYDKYAAAPGSVLDEDVQEVLPPCLGTKALLLGSGGALLLPFNKVIRFLEEGPENSTHWFVTAERRGP